MKQMYKKKNKLCSFFLTITNRPLIKRDKKVKQNKYILDNNTKF